MDEGTFTFLGDLMQCGSKRKSRTVFFRIYSHSDYTFVQLLAINRLFLCTRMSICTMAQLLTFFRDIFPRELYSGEDFFKVVLTISIAWMSMKPYVIQKRVIGLAFIWLFFTSVGPNIHAFSKYFAFDNFFVYFFHKVFLTISMARMAIKLPYIIRKGI